MNLLKKTLSLTIKNLILWGMSLSFILSFISCKSDGFFLKRAFPKNVEYSTAQIGQSILSFSQIENKENKKMVIYSFWKKVI